MDLHLEHVEAMKVHGDGQRWPGRRPDCCGDTPSFRAGLLSGLFQRAHVRSDIDTQFHVGSCHIRWRQRLVEPTHDLIGLAAKKTLPGAQATQRQVKMVAQRHGPFPPGSVSVGATAILPERGATVDVSLAQKSYTWRPSVFHKVAGCCGVSSMRSG